MTQTLPELLAAPLDPRCCEASAHPWWFILDPRAIVARAMSVNEAINAVGRSVVTGPFFSRESASKFLKDTRYNFGKDAVVWCSSGCFSEDYVALLEMAASERFLAHRDEAMKALFVSRAASPNTEALPQVKITLPPVVPPPLPSPIMVSTECIFRAAFEAIEAKVHDNARTKGWWEEDRNEAELIALEHAELSEALEALRHGNGPSEHIPEFSGVEEELADVIIRIMDHASAKGHRVAEAIIAKMAFNSTRPYKHGKKF